MSGLTGGLVSAAWGAENRAKQVVIVSPALADANNGNWQTAQRWQRLLHTAPNAGVAVSTRIVTQWPDGPAAAFDTVMLALHARRSAESVLAWAQRFGQSTPNGPTPGLAVVLTGTDLYRDIQSDAQAQRSLRLAQRLVVLQALGLQALPDALRERAQVIHQSTPQRATLPRSNRFRALMVGHLREEKSPQTLFAAAHQLLPHEGILLDHVGAALDPLLGAQAQATALICPHYRWLGGLPHERTRARIQRAHVLVHTSRMEGGAHVVTEAICSGTPVLASRIDGNVGLLGADYPGLFDWDNVGQLVALLRQCQQDPGFWSDLQARCVARAPLFDPATERLALQQLVAGLWTFSPHGGVVPQLGSP